MVKDKGLEKVESIQVLRFWGSGLLRFIWVISFSNYSKLAYNPCQWLKVPYQAQEIPIFSYLTKHLSFEGVFRMMYSIYLFVNL
jgi:hypothetical protein